MSKMLRPAVIEVMEQRLLFDVSLLTLTIDSSTLPTAISDQLPLHGSVTVTVANNSGADVKAPNTAVGIFISNGPLDVPSGIYGTLGSKIGALSIPNGVSKTIVIPIHLAKGKLADGVDTLTAVVAEPEGGFAQSASGGTLTVHPPIVTLSETEKFLKLADAPTLGSKFHVVDQVSITNSGTDPSTAPITIAIYATPDGIPADGVLMTGAPPKKITINAGKTVTVPVTIAAIPALSAGVAYKLITQVTQQNGTVTTTDPSTAPVITPAVATTGPQFSDSIISDTPTYSYETLDGAEVYLSNLKFEMSIKNTGSTTAGDDEFTLFASSSSAFDSSAEQVGQVTLDNLAVPHNGLRTFFVDFGLTKDLNDFSGNELDMYIYVQVKDPTGNITMASLPNPIKVSGPPT